MTFGPHSTVHQGEGYSDPAEDHGRGGGWCRTSDPGCWLLLADLADRSTVTGELSAALSGVRRPWAVQDPGRVLVMCTSVILDALAQVKVRTEQAQLRSFLAGQRRMAPCALCGHVYPMEFLVAAHIKKRAVCSDDERRDLHHIAMLACTFGCDALYESGWITVDNSGHAQTAPLPTALNGRFRDQLQHLAGRPCTAHNQHTEPHFDWHRTQRFRTTTN